MTLIPRFTARFFGTNPCTAFSAVLAFLILCFAGAGCQRLKHGAPNVVASVTITNRTLAEIGPATEVVFGARGYKGGRTGPGQFTFLRPGSTMDTVVYGDWIERKVSVRTVVTLREQAPGSVLASCDARLVSAPGDSVFEEDFKVPKSIRTECQEMLNEIQAQANKTAGSAPGDKPVP